jgi:hypothetical protein
MAKEYVKKYSAHCDGCGWASKYFISTKEAEAALKLHKHKYRVVEYYGRSPWDSRDFKKIVK